MDMSKAIREGRDRLGMSQEALAERLGVSRQAVSKWEMGTSVPSPENRRALSEILGTDLQVERETAPPVPLRRWKRLTLAAGLLCLALLAAATLWEQQPLCLNQLQPPQLNLRDNNFPHNNLRQYRQ